MTLATEIDYVLTHDPALLIAYHWLVLVRTKNRGKQLGVDVQWYDLHTLLLTARMIYPEHNGIYLKECLDNLKRKGVLLDVGD